MTLSDWKKKHDTGVTVTGVRARVKESSSASKPAEQTAKKKTFWYTAENTPNFDPITAGEDQQKSFATKKKTVVTGGGRGGATATKEITVPTTVGRLNKMTTGAIENTTAGMLNAAGTVVNGLSRLNDGENKTVANAGKKLAIAADAAQSDSAKQIQGAKEGLGKVGGFLVDTGVSGTQMITDAGVAALTGGSALVPMFIRSFGGGAQEARQAGGSFGQQLAYGAGSGAIEVGTEKIFNVAAPFRAMYGKGFLDSAVEKATTKFAKTEVGKAFLTAAASTASEGAEEFIGDVLYPVLKRTTGEDKNAKFDLSNAIYDSLVGGALGLVGASAQVVNGIQEGVQQSREGKASDAADQAYATMQKTGMFSPESRAAARDAQSRFEKAGYTSGAYSGYGQASRTPILDSVKSGSQTPVLDSTKNAKAQQAADLLTMKPSEYAQKYLASFNNGSQAQAGEMTRQSSVATQSGDKTAMRDAIVDIMLGQNKRVPQSSLTNEQFDAAATLQEQGKVGMDAQGNVFVQDPVTHIDNRTEESVGSRNVNAFQFDNPEMHSYYKQAAEDLLNDAQASLDTPATRRTVRTVQGKRTIQEISDSPSLRSAMDSGLSRNDIIKAAQALVSDHGQENYAAAKRLELVLDDMLTNGYTTMYGKTVEPNAEYLTEKNKIAGSNPQAGTVHDSTFNSIGAANAGFDPYSRMQNQYGTITPGENPARTVDVPAQTADNNKVSLTARTVSEAGATPESRIPTIEQATVDGKLSYIPITNKATAEKATQTIEKSGWQSALTDWTAEVRSGKTSADLTATGATLLNNAGNSAMSGTQYAELLSDYAQLLRNSGQAVQAARILKRLSPEGRLYMIQKSADAIAGEYGDKYNVTIDPDLIDEYRGAKTDKERDAVITKMQQNVADQMPSSLSDKFTALRYTNMLGNFKTQVRNVIGNAGMQPVRIAKDKIGAVIEAVADKASGGKIERTKSFVTDPSMFRAAWKDFEAVQNEALGEGKYQETGSQTLRDIQDKRTIFKNNGTWGTTNESNAFVRGLRKTTDVGWKAAEAYRKATNWAMEHGDVGFSRFTYADALAGYLQANGVKSIDTADADTLDKARSYAIKQAQEATYRDTNQFSDMVQGLLKFSNPNTGAKKAANAISQGLLPFRKTPANILARAEEYSPLGIVNTAYEAAKAHKGNATAADVIDSLSKTITGTGLVALGAFLYGTGAIRGKDDGDQKQANFDDLLGHQAYSLELPNGISLTLDWLAPESMPFFVGVNAAESAADNGLTLADGTQAALSISDPMLQMSMLQGVNDSLNNLKYGDDSSSLAKFVSNEAFAYLSQGLTNTLAGQIERSSEPVRMTTFTDKNSQLSSDAQYTIGKMSAKIPGVDYNQIPYIDAWGRTQSEGSTAERVFNNFLNPSYVSDVDIRPVEQELQRVADKTGSTSVFPQRAEQSFTVSEKDENGKTTRSYQKNLTAAEYQTYAKSLGSTKYALLKEATGSSYYKAMTDDEKADYISSLYAYSNAVSKMRVSNYAPDEWIMNARTAKKDLGVSTAEYIALKEKYGSAYLSGKGYEKTKQAVSEGMTVGEYVSMKQGIDTNDNGSVSQAEAKSYLSKTDYTTSEKEKIWNIVNSSWKHNPYK